MMRIVVRLPIAAAAAVLLYACSSLFGPQPDQSRYFVLTAAVATPSATAPGANAYSIGLGPVRLPSYLSSHDEIATRVEANRVEYSSSDFWAEAIDTNFSRVLERNLDNILDDAQIVSFPWVKSTNIDYQVEVAVERFERDPKGDSQLLVHWTISDGKDGRILLDRESTIAHPAQSSSTDAAVAALSADVGDLSDQIATAVRSLRDEDRSHPRGKPAS
jgi:uncharacterized protein